MARAPPPEKLIPTHGGRRGHPVRFCWRHVNGIRPIQPDRGINFHVREHAAEVREIDVETPSVFCDLDTPEDYGS